MLKQFRAIACVFIVAILLSLTACGQMDNGSEISSAPESTIEVSSEETVSEVESETEASEDSPSNSQPKESSEEKTASVHTESSVTPSAPTSATITTPTPTPPPTHTHKWTTNKVAATCTSVGYTLKSCSCGETQKTDTVNALGHSWSEWKIEKQATTTETGLKVRTCTRCKTEERQVTDKIPTTAEDWNEEILRLVNEERAKVGLNPLQYYHAAQSAADIRADEIKESFSHTRPNGESCFTALDDLSIRYTAAGENIAYGQRSPEDVMNAWMNSEGHRNNILSANFTHIVVGAKDYRWVQLFLRV